MPGKNSFILSNDNWLKFRAQIGEWIISAQFWTCTNEEFQDNKFIVILKQD
jgi:hypothetical protein